MPKLTKMVSIRARGWGHESEQQVLLEFGSLKDACPEGVYLSLTPGAPTAWSGIFFVRKGPYAPAILRFKISFPSSYPTLPPAITFVSDIFHPLVTPLTTYTYTTGSSSSDTVSATDDERLPPGGFSLRHGFPHWFGRKQKSIAASKNSSRDVSGSYDGREQMDGILEHLMGKEGSEVSSPGPRSPDPKGRLALGLAIAEQPSIIEVLRYMKAAFDEENILSTLPLEAAGNPGAWHAWQAHWRNTRLPKSPKPQDESQKSRPKQPGDWNWDGVWLERVKRGIDASISESVLYGSAVGGEDPIHFSNLNDATLQDVRESIANLA